MKTTLVHYNHEVQLWRHLKKGLLLVKQNHHDSEFPTLKELKSIAVFQIICCNVVSRAQS